MNQLWRFDSPEAEHFAGRGENQDPLFIVMGYYRGDSKNKPTMTVARGLPPTDIGDAEFFDVLDNRQLRVIAWIPFPDYLSEEGFNRLLADLINHGP